MANEPGPTDNNLPADQKDTEDRVILEWTCHPMRKRPVATVIVTLFVFVVTAAVFYTTYSRTFAVLALVILLLSLAKFYFPTTYRFTEKQVIIKTTTQRIARDWSQYRTCWPDKNGVLLSPFTRPSRMENFRGIYLMFNDNRDEVMAEVQMHIAGPDDDELDDVRDVV
ncbi:MAG TPA: hypothetical protein PLF13_01445 [candidate division Zixibacteria bacterium]|nr:hypothetical protein [candidate division Zixibacteria bacterium]